MTNEEILKKALTKIVKNKKDWNPGMAQFYLNNENDYINSKVWQIYIIFSHDFAKAFWGEPCKFCKEHIAGRVPGIRIPKHKHNPGWQFHLQQMVLEKEPLKYIERFLLGMKKLLYITATIHSILCFPIGLLIADYFLSLSSIFLSGLFFPAIGLWGLSVIGHWVLALNID